MQRLLLLLVLLVKLNTVHAQWRKINNAPIVNGRLDDVSFANDSVGWIAQGSDVFKTTDAGESWSQVSFLPFFSSGYVRSVEFLNDTLGFFGTLTNSSDPAALFKTTDGGITFTNINNLLPHNNEGICGMAHYNQHIIAAGVFSSTSPSLFKSTDGGGTWTFINLSAYASGLVDCYMFDENNFIVCGKSTAGTGERAIILRTSDGGTTWQQVALVSATGFSYIWKMFFLSSGVGFASVEEQPMIMKTTDYGNTWTEINLNQLGATGNGALGAIGALNDSIIWVGRQFSEGMYGSLDGGDSWTYYAHFGNKMDRMTMIDTDHLICVGETVYKYTAGDNTVPFEPSENGLHHQVKIQPNPVNGEIKIKLNLFQSTHVSLDLLDIQGRMVKKFYNGTLDEGKQEKIFSVKDIANGNYILLFRSNEEFIQKRVQVQQ
jgi:photosystem II stability/assembly factor-like uncharacterized protein